MLAAKAQIWVLVGWLLPPLLHTSPSRRGRPWLFAHQRAAPSLLLCPYSPSCGPLQNISSTPSPTFVSFCFPGSHPGKHHVGEMVCPPFPLRPHGGAIWSTGDYKGLLCVSAPPRGLPPHGEGVGNDGRHFDVFRLCIWNRTHVKCHLVLSSSDVSGSARGTTAPRAD